MTCQVPKPEGWHCTRPNGHSGPCAAVAMYASANQRMIGGDHYKHDAGEEHWDRIWRMYGAGYFVGCVTKYVERYHRKNGIEDLEKAQHFLEKLIELEKAKKVKDESERVSTSSPPNTVPPRSNLGEVNPSSESSTISPRCDWDGEGGR